MSGRFDKKTKGQPGTVSRVVPGRLAYVDVPSMGGTFPIKPDKFAVQSADGTIHHYKGEPFSQIGVSVGAPVNIISDLRQVGSVVVGPPKKRNFMRRLLNYQV